MPELPEVETIRRALEPSSRGPGLDDETSHAIPGPDPGRPNGQPRRRLDATRAEELFGFRSETPLREGLAQTVAWYREHAPVGATG